MSEPVQSSSSAANDDLEKIQVSTSASHNAEGSYYQSQLGPKPKRKHFFSSLDPSYANAVNRDAETVEFTAQEDVCPIRSEAVVKSHLMSCLVPSQAED